MIEKLARILTRKPVVVAVIAAAMLLPSVLGMAATRINYDILTYLPEELESVQGERLLEEPFQMAATSMLIVEGMPAAYSSELINEIKQMAKEQDACVRDGRASFVVTRDEPLEDDLGKKYRLVDTAKYYHEWEMHTFYLYELAQEQ